MRHKYFENFNFKVDENVKQEDEIIARDKSRVSVNIYLIYFRYLVP